MSQNEHMRHLYLLHNNSIYSYSSWLYLLYYSILQEYQLSNY